MEHAPGHTSATRAIGGLVFVAASIGLVLQLTEPFSGTSTAYAGRMLGPAVTVLLGAHLFLQRRAHPVFVTLIVVLSLLSLLFVLAGLRH